MAKGPTEPKPPAGEGEPKTGGVAAAARLLGVSERQVQKLADMGMPCTKNSQGHRVFVLADAVKWHRENIVQNRHGGAGRGQGRKPGTGHRALGTGGEKRSERKSETKPRAAVPPDRIGGAPTTGLGPAMQAMGRGIPKSDGDRQEPVDPCTLGVADLGKLPRVTLDSMLMAEKILLERVKREILESTLVPLSEAKKAWAERCNIAARALRTMGRTLAPVILRELGISPTPAKSAAVRNAIDARVDAAMGDLARVKLGMGETKQEASTDDEEESEE